MSHSSIINCPRIFTEPESTYAITTLLTESISSIQDNNFTISATNTENFKASGYIQINQEIFFYQSKTKTTFNNVYRALKDTSRKDHISN